MPCENEPIQVIVVSISGHKPSNLSVYRVEAVQCIYSYSRLSLCVDYVCVCIYERAFIIGTGCFYYEYI